MRRRTLLSAGILCLLFLPLLYAEVKNRDRPAKGEWDLNPEKVWQVDRAGDDVFGLPFTLRSRKEGSLFIYDLKNDVNYIFDAEGTFIRKFAPGGQGPGEIGGQGRTFLVDDKVIISGANAFHYFTREGDYLRTARLEGANLPAHLFLNEDELIAAPLTGFHTPDGRGKILLRNLRLGSETVLAEFSSFEGGVGRSGEQVFDMIVVGLSPLLTIGQDRDRICWGLSDAYLIHVTDLEGKPINAFSVNRKPTKISDRVKRGYFKNPNLPADVLGQIVDSFPDALTFFHRIEWHNGLIYVFVPELDLEVGRPCIRQIDIFSPEGEYLYRAKIELEKGLRPVFSPLDNLIISGNFLYAACEKEDDTVVIVKYHIDLPGR